MRLSEQHEQRVSVGERVEGSWVEGILSERIGLYERRDGAFVVRMGEAVVTIRVGEAEDEKVIVLEAYGPLGARAEAAVPGDSDPELLLGRLSRVVQEVYGQARTRWRNSTGPRSGAYL